MLQGSTSGRFSERTLVDRVLSALASFSCARVWARPVGRHVLLGLNGEAPFARLTALAGGSYGLAFQGERGGRWDLLLVDDLPAVVEHALIGAGALTG
ncbi:MAG: hypothetical protein M3O46_10230 [Myxococcota bacterium]|nr:hypothetical protein [Myxococcota bacterium]